METNKIKAEIRVPTLTYGYINFFVEVEDNGYAEKEIIAQHNRMVKSYQDSLKTPETTPNSIPNLAPVNLLRLLYKPLCEQGMTEEEMNSLGTSKDYSQRDILKIVQSLINKSKRDEEKENIENDLGCSVCSRPILQCKCD